MNVILATIIIVSFCVVGVAFAFAGHPILGFIIIITILFAIDIRATKSGGKK